MMYAGSDEHTMRHKWVINKDSTRPEREVKLVTDRKDDRAPGGWARAVTGYCRAFERDLSKLAKEKAHEVMQGKRNTAKKNKIPQKGLRLGADHMMSCPVIAAIGTRTRDSGGSSGPSADPEVRHIFWMRTTPESTAVSHSSCYIVYSLFLLLLLHHCCYTPPVFTTLLATARYIILNPRSHDIHSMLYGLQHVRNHSDSAVYPATPQPSVLPPLYSCRLTGGTPLPHSWRR